MPRERRAASARAPLRAADGHGAAQAMTPRPNTKGVSIAWPEGYAYQPAPCIKREMTWGRGRCTANLARAYTAQPLSTAAAYQRASAFRFRNQSPKVSNRAKGISIAPEPATLSSFMIQVSQGW